MSQVPTSVPKSIPWKQISVPEHMNVRSDLPEIKEIASSMKVRGQLQPIVVTNGGDEAQPYRLVAGNRRHAAFELNGWQNKEILCVVREYKKGDAVARLVDNWHENSERVDVSAFDQAERAHQMVHGTYPVFEGETAEPIAKAQVAEMLGVSTSQLNNLLRIYTNIDADVSRKARKARVPVRILIAWAGLEGKGKDAEAKENDRAEKQAAHLEEWVDAQKMLEEAGRKRAPKSATKSKNKDELDEAKSGIISAEKKIPSGYVEKGEEEPKAKKYTPVQYMFVLKSKQAEAGEVDAARLQGAIDAFRFFTGEVGKLPGLTASDFKVLDETEETEEEEEEVEA